MSSPTSVYFISDGEHVKIGVAHDPTERLQALQTANPKDLELLTTVEFESKGEAHSAEKMLHRRLAGHHIRGEWFRLDVPKILAALCGQVVEDNKVDSALRFELVGPNVTLGDVDRQVERQNQKITATLTELVHRPKCFISQALSDGFTYDSKFNDVLIALGTEEASANGEQDD